MHPLKQATGPNGEIVVYDRAATQAAYSSFDGAPCTCLGCRNFRAAFELDSMDTAVRDMCSTLGIDPFKAVETTFYDTDPATGLAVYSGEYLFVGRVLNDVAVHTAYWAFSVGLVRQPAFGDDQAALHFSMLLPWRLSERPPK